MESTTQIPKCVTKVARFGWFAHRCVVSHDVIVVTTHPISFLGWMVIWFMSLSILFWIAGPLLVNLFGVILFFGALAAALAGWYVHNRGFRLVLGVLHRERSNVPRSRFWELRPIYAEFADVHSVHILKQYRSREQTRFYVVADLVDNRAVMLATTPTSPMDLEKCRKLAHEVSDTTQAPVIDHIQDEDS